MIALVVAIGLGGADILADQALTHVWGYAAGNDLTRRDLQAEAKATQMVSQAIAEGELDAAIKAVADTRGPKAKQRKAA